MFDKKEVCLSVPTILHFSSENNIRWCFPIFRQLFTNVVNYIIPQTVQRILQHPCKTDIYNKN